MNEIKMCNTLKEFTEKVCETADWYNVNSFSDLGTVAKYGAFEARIEQCDDVAWNSLECCVTVYHKGDYILSRPIGGCWETSEYVVQLRIEQYLERKGETA